jgi:16S rRNA processing protein RimM
MSEAGTDHLVIGRIGGVYGVSGWVRVQSFTEPEENLLGYERWLIRRKGQWQAIVIDAGRRHGKGLVAHIEGVDDRNAAELLKGSDIAIRRQELPRLHDGDYYWHQLEGLQVWAAGELLGQIDHMMETGSNDVMVIKPCEGSRDGRERLVPWLQDSVVGEIDLDAGTVQVEWDAEF